MSDITQILSAATAGDPKAAEELMPLVYDELRKLAAARMAGAAPGQTLQPTALVHEAYLRLVGSSQSHDWHNRGHFFAAAAEAMRRILIDRARHKLTEKAGGGLHRQDVNDIELPEPEAGVDLLALNEVLGKLEQKDRRKAELVKLRFFIGLTNEKAAAVLGISTTTADKDWAYARAWLRAELGGPAPAPSES